MSESSLRDKQDALLLELMGLDLDERRRVYVLRGQLGISVCELAKHATLQACDEVNSGG